MKHPLSFLIAQINTKVGDIQHNRAYILDVVKTNQDTHDMIIFPELALSGYPPEDLLLHPTFYIDVEKALEEIQSKTQDCYVVLGHPHQEKNCIFNRVSVFHQQRCVFTYDKHHLPNYGVFDEKRYFTSGALTAETLHIKGHAIGFVICEDIWQPGPVETHLENKTELLIVINASPFDTDKPSQRERLLKNYAQKGIAILYTNLIGGQDELVFDGQSLFFDPQGQLSARLPAFEEKLSTIHYYDHKHIEGLITPTYTKEALIYKALCTGLQDYVRKNGFKSVLVGLSGGIDSALTLAIAVDALGAKQVEAILMPSRYTADMSNEDAILEAQMLGVTFQSYPIEPTFETVLNTLQSGFKNRPPDLTEENIQARIRGLFLMALSNKMGKLVLTTSNKSEMSVGYATLYGDMCGAFGVLKDLFKTEVYALAKYRNKLSPVIPERVIQRAPSAELRFEQTDQDHLPDYDTLDAILDLYVEKKRSITEIVQLGFDVKQVEHILSLIAKNEYKRQQAAPGVKISPCAFGKDWRYPITCGFKPR